MPSTTTAPLARLLAELRWRRRPVAAAIAVLALLVALDAVRPAGPPTAEVLVAARALPAGRVVSLGDLALVRRPSADVPDGALRSPPVGRVLALPIRAGEVVTDVRVLDGDLLAALGPDFVAAPVHLADESATGLVRVGDRVDVLAAGEGTGAAGAITAATSALVLRAPDAGSGSALRPRDTDTIVVLGVTRATASALAGAAATDRLSVVLRSSDAG